MGPATATSAEGTFDVLGPIYDRFAAHHDHAAWIRSLEALAREHGLDGRRALDLACGTGMSTVPLVELGYEVLGCDLSEAMLEQARSKLGRTGTRLIVADMRELPLLGEFDLVACICDSLNYLLEPNELEAAFEGVARNLAAGGVFVFDLNSLRTYRTIFARDHCFDRGDALFVWRGQTARDLDPGGSASAQVDAFLDEDGLWRRTTACHLQRHHPADLALELLAAAGFTDIALRGQHMDGRIDPDFDESLHTKAIYFARTT